MKDKTFNILVVDDSPDALELVKRNLESGDNNIITASNVNDALSVLADRHLDLVITDLKMPGASGLDITRHIRENYKDIEVIMITGYPTIDGAVEAVKLGASEYLTKPFTEDELRAAVDKILLKVRMKRMNAQSAKKSLLLEGLIGESDAMKGVTRLILKASSTNATVLISGESGTGKEIVARSIHYQSSRASNRFLPVNCGGIPEELLESELFGYVKGSFTGANETRAGFFQTADGGTIFLDEISETSMSMQVKLLRVLQDRQVYMIGSRKPQKVDVRIIAATNRNIQHQIEKNLFREDLFFRLNVINIQIPPLRERGNDISLLINHFTNRYASESDKPMPVYTDRAMDILLKYSWPGNVRELENIVQRLVIMNEDGRIDAPELPDLMRFSVSGSRSANRTLDEVEKEHILNVLRNADGNKTKAAEVLGIDRKTLREKVKKYNIDE